MTSHEKRFPMAQRLVAAVIASSWLVSCTTSRQLSCHNGESPLTLDTLYFGTASPAGPVTETQWKAFLEKTVSAEFPKGYTVLQGDGAWRGESGELEQEKSYVLQLVHENNADAERGVTRVISEYKQQFKQE